MKVLKRTKIGNESQLEQFDLNKIINAVAKAYASQNEDMSTIVREELKQIPCKHESASVIGVETIQEDVEKILMKLAPYEVTRAYITYRESRKKLREFAQRKIDFIENYKKSDNTANATIDDNSNVSNHNIAVLNSEIHKEDNQAINLRIWETKLKELYPNFDYKQMRKDFNSICYPHDLNSQVGMPYTYSAKEVVEVMYNSHKLLLPLDLLYSIVESNEKLVDEGNIVYQKVPWNLYVKDYNDKWTKITKLTKKKRHRPLVRVKTAFGEDIVVTDNHPMITDVADIENTIQAKDSLGYKQYRVGTQIDFLGKTELDMVSILPTWVSYEDSYIKYQQTVLKRIIPLNRDLGYIVGFFVGDGGYNNTHKYLELYQKEKGILKDINNKVYSIFGVAGTLHKNTGSNCNKYVLSIKNQYIFELFKGYFKIQDKAQNKTLPYNILEFNEEFAKGCLEGLIDSDGTIKNEDCVINIRLSSRACILQCTYLFRHFGYSIGNGIQSLPFSNNKSYTTNYTIWGISATKRNTSVKLNGSFKVRDKLANTKCKSLKYKAEGYCNITNTEEIEENSSFYSQNEFIYDITTETHTFCSNNLLVHNCVAISMYPFLNDGIKKIGGLSAKPKNIDSFCGMFVNLVFAIASQFKGAVAAPGLFVCMDWYLRKEWGDNYYDKTDLVISSIYSNRKQTIAGQIHQYFQQICYSLMQPSGSRGNQAVFWNCSVFDKPFFDTMYGDFYYPDGSKAQWESINWLQKDFLHWLNQERLKCVLTFPVVSACLIYQGHKFLDKDLYEYLCDEYAQGNSFFTYISDSADSLSSCCFSKDTKVLWKSSFDGVKCTTLEELHNLKWEPYKKNLRIFHNGSWVKGKSIKLPCRDMYKVTTYNNKEFYITDNHINVTLNGEKPTSELTTNDYLLFNTQALNGIPENDEGLTYAEGILVGAFLGDGTISGHICQDGSIHSMDYSLNEEKFRKLAPYLDTIKEKYNMHYSLNTPYNNVYPVKVYSKEFIAFIIKWTNWIEHTTAFTKELNLNCLLQSIEFRQGILDGWYITDGGNSNRCYTVSEKLKDAMEILITSLGLQSIIDVTDRTDEKVIIRGESFNRNYPLYCIRFYNSTNHRVCKNLEHTWIKRNNSIYFRIKSIEKVNYKDDVYCIECNNNEEPYFTLPSGLITHNCRLSSKISKPQFNFTNGQLSEMTGSKNVITLNLNRITQDYFKTVDTNYFGASGVLCKDITEEDMQGFGSYLKEILERIYKYQTAYNEILKDLYNNNLLTVYKAGFISMKKQYLTIGINGLNQAAEFLGLQCNKNKDYESFCNFIFSTIKEQNQLHKTNELMFNTEFTPCESASIKLYNRDKKDGYWVPEDTNLYASYIYKPNDVNISTLDKIYLHGRNFCGDNLDGGSSSHLNLDSHLSKEQYKKLLKYAAEVGCKYFTFNVPNCECEDCGFIAKQPFTKCPKCGSTNISLWDRVIGYLTKIKNWSTGRQIEQKTRVYSKEFNN